MASFSLLLLLLLLPFLVASANAAAHGGVTDARDAKALAQIRETYRIEKNWSGDDDPCGSSWEGVGCDNTSTPSRVVSLDLSQSGLVGRLSPSFAHLTQLKRLDLSANMLEGGIPDFLSDQLRLEYLDLSCSGLDQPIPEALLLHLKISHTFRLKNAPCNQHRKMQGYGNTSRDTDSSSAGVFLIFLLVVLSLVILSCCCISAALPTRDAVLKIGRGMNNGFGGMNDGVGGLMDGVGGLMGGVGGF